MFFVETLRYKHVAPLGLFRVSRFRNVISHTIALGEVEGRNPVIRKR